MASVILTVIGSDRPGLTGAVADAVLSVGGNWLESHLSRLGGLYVGSVLVELGDDRLEALRSAIRSVDAQGLDVRITPAAAEASPALEAGEALQLGVVGQDRPGIVRQVTAVLAGLGVNIERFTTSVEHEAHSGRPLFRADARLRLPAGADIGAVQAALEQISGEIMVDLSTAPAADGTA
jgi:glycine cleavage system regulatory protein